MNFLNSILHGVAVKIGSGLLVLSHLFVPASPTVLGDYNTTGGGTYRTQASVSSTQTTVTLSSFKEPISNIRYTMSYLNSSIEYGTIEPQSTNREFISFSGITQNSDGTATLTGVSRGLSPSYPFTASTTFQLPHSGQSVFILSNPPQLTNQYLNKNNSDSIGSGIYVGFTDPPYFVNSATSTSQAASVAYVNSVSFGTALILKAFGGTGLTGFPANSFIFDSGSGTTLSATSSPTVDNIWATSTAKTNYFAGPVTANSTLGVTGNTTLTGNLVASSTTNVIASSTQYTINVGQINATSTPKVNGNPIGDQIVYLTNDTTGMSNSSATTTILTYTMPANTMGVNKMMRITAQLIPSFNGNATLCEYNIDFGTGLATTTIAYGQVNLSVGNGKYGWGDLKVVGFATTTSSTLFTSQSTQSVSALSTPGGLLVNTFSSPTVGQLANMGYIGAARATTPLTATSYIAFRAKNDGTTFCYVSGATIEILSQ